MSKRSGGAPAELWARMYTVMVATARQFFTSDSDAEAAVRPHVWRNSDYVRISDGQVQAWYGWSISFRPVAQKYRTLYFDYVQNTLLLEQRRELFGNAFVQATMKYDRFVFLFITSCSIRYQTKVVEQGLVFRTINEVIHPGHVASDAQFLECRYCALGTAGGRIGSVATSAAS